MHFTQSVLVLAAAVIGEAAAGAIGHMHGKLHNHALRQTEVLKREAGISKRGILDTDVTKLTSLGIPTIGVNSFTPTSNVWIGTEGPYTNEFTNESGDDLILTVWGVAGSWVNAVQPLVTQSLAPNETTTLSFANGASGAWAAIYPDTKMVNGQVSETWGEFTFSGVWSTVDVSREVNMLGHKMTIVTPTCVSDMETCVFVCKDGAETCWLDYELLNCAANNGGGTGTDSLGAPSGGCNGMGDSAALQTYLS